MKIQLILGSIGILALALVGCASQGAGQSRSQSAQAASASALRIDGRTRASTKSTLMAMYRAHSDSDQCMLHHTLLRLHHAEQSGMLDPDGDTSTPPPPLRVLINGKTYDQIIKLSDHYPDIQSKCESSFQGFGYGSGSNPS